MNNTSEDVKIYLRSEFQNLLNNANHFEWIDSHAEREYPPASYLLFRKQKNLLHNLVENSYCFQIMQ